MSDIDIFTEYGVFVQHGSSEVLLKCFRKYEVLEQWRGIVEDDMQQKITAIRARQVNIQRGAWSDEASPVEAGNG